uniref:Large ribosomal subunit protein bL20m n=1 Tax=Pseudonaja textilis TaxID=8673 RepID=A0A670YAI9_PSETE
MVFFTLSLWPHSRVTDRFWCKQRNLKHALIEAASLEHNVKYHNFISGLYKCQVELNWKSLAKLAIYEPKTFKSLAALAKRRGDEGLLVAQGEGKEPEGIFSCLLKHL